MPFLIIGVEQGENVLPDTAGIVAHAAVVVHLRPHIPLGDFLLVAVLIHFQDLRGMKVFRHSESEILEELDVLRQTR